MAEPEIIDMNTLERISRAELDVQITTARRYPRNLTTALRDAETMACLDPDTAASMFYVLMRDGKRIEGPSVRLAEIFGSAWTNLRFGSRIIDISEKFVTAQGACLDLEKNTGISIETRRRITDKLGRRYSEDMITMTCNAAAAIALRNAVFKIIPGVYIAGIFAKAKLTSLGQSMSLSDRRAAAFEYFQKIGAKEEDVFRVLGKRGMDDVDMDDIVTLRGFRTAISENETTWQDIMKGALVDAAAAPTKTIEDLAAKLDKPKADVDKTTGEVTTPPPQPQPSAPPVRPPAQPKAPPATATAQEPEDGKDSQMDLASAEAPPTVETEPPGEPPQLPLTDARRKLFGDIVATAGDLKLQASSVDDAAKGVAGTTDLTRITDDGLRMILTELKKKGGKRGK